MASQINVRSRQQILGSIVRKVVNRTDITDFSRGSDVASVLEGIASAIAQAESTALQILENIDVDSLSGTNLDKKAQSLRIPNGRGGYGRRPAVRSSGSVLIGSAFEKTSSQIYAGKPAPFAGSTTLFIENGSSFPAAGSVYIARGTVDRFEGPIPYSSIVNNGAFWTITLTQPLTKDHLTTDAVTLSQGGDRVVKAGTTVQVPANSGSPAIAFSTTQDLVIPDGEAEGRVSVVADKFGTSGNVLSGAITTFSGTPFPGATVTNTTTFRNGRSTEDDESLRQRIKNYPSTLSRGVEQAIVSALEGAVDSASGRSIQTATVISPAEPGDSAKVFIDDGTGLEPSFGNQPSELLLQSAAGQETQFRTAQFPITAVLAEGSERAPYVLNNTMSLTVQLDEVVETYTVTPSNYVNLSAASAFEIVRDLNSQSNLLGFRTIENGNRIVAIDLSGGAEQLNIFAGDFQEELGFPVADLRPIFLYKNSELLSFRGSTATLETRARNLWNITASDLQNIRVKVGEVIQEFSINDSDFSEFNSTISSATVGDWAAVFAKKIAGVKFTVSGQIIVWSSYNTFNPAGTLEILTTRADGSDAPWIGDDKIWATEASGGKLSDAGATKDFLFNRFLGSIRLLEKPDAGDKIEIATRDTRAFLSSLESDNGLFTLDPLPSSVGNSKLILGFDGNFEIRSTNIASGTEVTPTVPDSSGASNVVRLSANQTGAFDNAQVGDYMYLLPDQSVTGTILPAGAEGFYRLMSVGFQKTATDAVFSGLVGATEERLNLLAATTKDLATVQITLADHGYKTGDLITVNQTSAAIGGISTTDLSVANTPITVLDSNNFTYQAAAAANTSASGTLDEVGTNLITVTQSSHSMETGSYVDVVVSSGFGGISSGDLSVSGAPVEVIDENTYKYRAAAAATSSTSSQTVDSVTQLADTWVEFEVSSVQLTTWSTMLSTAHSLSSDMLYLFRSDDATPQLVDFGNSVSTQTVDQIVSAINSQVAGGAAVKRSPRQLDVRSNDYELDGTCAVLAVIGNSANVFAAAEATSIQAHVANSSSESVYAGAPLITGVELPTGSSSGYPTRKYLTTDRNITDVLNTNTNPTIESPTAYNSVYPEGFQHLWITGRAANFSSRVYNNQTTAPYTGVMTNIDDIAPLGTFDVEQTSPDTLDRYANFGFRLRDLPLNNYDALVVEMDLQPTERTVGVAMAKLAEIQDIDTITGSGKGQVISFRLLDPEDSNLPFFDNTSVYKDFDFTDFKILTKTVGLYREDASSRAVVLRSVDFGATANLRLSLRYPTEPDQSDVLITHTTGYFGDKPSLTIIATLSSGSLIAGASLNAGEYRIEASANGTLFDWRISAPTLNSGSNYAVGNVLNISGKSSLSGSYQITDASYFSVASAAANVSNGSSVVTVTAASHGLQTGDIVQVTTSTAIGGISAIDLSVTTSVTVLNANTFTYVANATATSNDSGNLDSIVGGQVTVIAPGDGGLSPAAIYNAAQSPIRTWTLGGSSFPDVAAAINAYLPDAPVATAQAFGTSTAISDPTYVSYSNTAAYTESDMSGAFNHHTFSTKYSGSAGIWQYDSSVPSANGIKATVQSDDSIFPTAAEASGTSYSPIGEQVQIVPTNTKTMQKWLSFSAISSLSVLTEIDRTKNDTVIQLSSAEDGGDGAVRVTGVTANQVEDSIIGNASVVGDTTRFTSLAANVRSLMPGQFINVKNSISAEILREYRDTPTGSSITAANTTDINTYFRSENSIKYVRVNQNTGRIIFLRNGMNPSQDEPLDTDNEITLTDLGNGLVQVTSAQGVNPDSNTGNLSARVGDMMYIQPGSNFPVDVRCKAVPAAGRTAPSSPEYLGYPVVHVIDDKNIIIIAPNITTFTTTTLVDGRELVFIPAIYNEKNIRTNHAAGAKFDDVINDNKAYFIVKPLGDGFVSVFLQNSSAESTDDMLLDNMSVNTDDFAIFGSGFNPANQGTFRIVSHNGRNHMIVYNNAGGTEEVFAPNELNNGGAGRRKWGAGILDDGFDRDLRIVSADSVRIGDKVRISTPPTAAQWFNDEFIGSWEITGIGLQALDYAGLSLPHDGTDGSYDQNFVAPYIDFTIPNAPESITDAAGADVDLFLIGANDSAIGFTEGTPFSSYRMVDGHAVSSQNTENRDMFLKPQLSTQKMSSAFGTAFEAIGKLSFVERTFQGIDGYKIYSGLVREAHRIIDGLPQNTIVYEGVKAAGSVIDVQTPLIRSVQVELQVRPTDGVTLNSISELIKSAVAGYINDLGVGNAVVISEIQSTVQSLPGVFSVSVVGTLPAASDDRIVVGSNEKPFVLDVTRDITVG